MVSGQYKPAELAKSEWEAVQQGPPWAVDSWGLGCMMQVGDWMRIWLVRYQVAHSLCMVKVVWAVHSWGLGCMMQVGGSTVTASTWLS
jgi:hypothetical protein